MANNLQEAACEWARLTCHNDPLFNKKELTYFGWPIVKTDKKPLQRKERLGFVY